MSAQQKYLYQYAYLDGSSFNAVENNKVYNDNRGLALGLQNYNHNSLNLNFKAGEYTAKALSVLLASSEVGLILEPVTHDDLVNENVDVYDLVKVGNVGLNPNLHFYEVGGEFLSNEMNNVDFLTRRFYPHINQGGDIGIEFATISDGTNDYVINVNTLTNGVTSFYYPTGDDEGAPVALIDLRDMAAFSITFNGNSIPANFLSGFVNSACVMTITNAVSIMSIGNNAFANSEFDNIIANFSGVRELGSGVKLAKTGGEITTANPLGLVAYDDLSIVLTNDVKEIDGLIIASDFFASGSQRILNDTCNALSHFMGTLTEVKNCTIVEDFANLKNLDPSEVVFDGCTFAVNQDFSSNLETQILTIRNCNQESTGDQEFVFTDFAGSIIIENSFKSAEAVYVVDDDAAYALEIDNNSFINAGADSGSLNKVLSNENRSLPLLEEEGAFLRINDLNIVSFSGTSFLTLDNQIVTIATIQTISFPNGLIWNLQNGNFAFANFGVLSNLILYNESTLASSIAFFQNGSFYKMTIPDDKVKIIASQLLDILSNNNCFTSTSALGITVYNDLPTDFNYLTIARNNTSFIFEPDTEITLLNDTDDLLKNALEVAYPEYNYL